MGIFAEVSHNFKLIGQTLFSFVSWKTALFWKGFYCELLSIFNSFNLIDCCKISFPEFSERFKFLVEAFLMNFPDQMFCPCFYHWGWSIERTTLTFISVEFEADFRAFYRILSEIGSTCYWWRTSNLRSNDRETCPTSLGCPLVQSEIKMWLCVRVRERDEVGFSMEVVKLLVRRCVLGSLLLVFWVESGRKIVFQLKLGLILSISIEIVV